MEAVSTVLQPIVSVTSPEDGSMEAVTPPDGGSMAGHRKAEPRTSSLNTGAFTCYMQTVGGGRSFFAARGHTHVSVGDEGHLTSVVGMPLLRPEPGVPPARGKRRRI